MAPVIPTNPEVQRSKGPPESGVWRKPYGRGACFLLRIYAAPAGFHERNDRRVGLGLFQAKGGGVPRGPNMA